MSRPSYVLKASCADTTGIVAAVTGFLARRESLIMELTHFVDEAAQKSFLRVEFEDDAQNEADLAVLSDAFEEAVARYFGMEFAFYPTAVRMPALVAVSKQGHCITSLLHRWKDGHLPVDIKGIVSNHEDQRALAEWYGLPFYHLPIDSGKKERQEEKLLDLFRKTGAELLVLARYMQILSAEACAALDGRAINIHHSFLPAFMGGNPYKQAYERGVKIIGATSHYVTEDLDEGPIIEQDIIRISHRDSVEHLKSRGRDLERIVLAKAVSYHAEHRILVNGKKTVVFE